MNNFLKLTDKKQIESHFRKNTNLNLYQIGDLDDFFWKYTEWFAVLDEKDEKEIKQILLFYSGSQLPVLLGLCDGDFEYMKLLLVNFKKSFPEKFYSHLSPGLADSLSDIYTNERYGTYLKMSLRREDLIVYKDENIRRLSTADIDMVKKFYKKSYPGNWFDNRMLETGKYFGYFIEGKMAGVAGIHVYSPKYRVAALGNITTSPVHRGKLICTKLTSSLCKDLFETVDNIGLNVYRENESAIRSYKKIGFKITAEYEEIMFYKTESDK